MCPATRKRRFIKYKDAKRQPGAPPPESGFGSYRYTNGDVYKGEWQGGEPSGYGTKRYHTGCVYTGNWAGGKYEGYGTLRTQSGMTYDGEWKGDMECGHGTMKYPDGVVYTGEWVDGQRCGEGKLTWTEGFIEEGVFVDNHLEGDVRVTDPRGAVRQVVYRDGKLADVCTSCNQKESHKDAPEYVVYPAAPKPLTDAMIARMVYTVGRLRPCDKLGDISKEFGVVTCDPLTTHVIYLRDTTPFAIEEFSKSLATTTLSSANLCAAKSPSALKRDLAQDPSVILCTHEVLSAGAGSKLHKLHMALWRDLVKRGVTARAYWCLDEDSVSEDEDGARGEYMRLVELVRTHYVAKLPGEAQRQLWERADTLQCIPLNRYFEDVWGEM
ncbi:hypothetical protein KIPB_003641 [Kipferlia bialata]|uniref:Uncharacterized protein n=1 Tax=Kipferlia bialata TaxID=797122 RepID=A0A9K3CP90_9EUKA|nr:hypothetical protein KIPB_000521 [Kipferlia bialata]GIQ82490.1 hypothetical protein KIPB_003641 [Kipferlia bialata]|eukprot:g521.t1